MNKKGSVPDMIYFVVIMFLLAFVVVILWVLFQAIDTSFQATDSITNEGKSIESGIKNRFVSIMNNVFLLGFVGFFIAIVIGAWFIRVHPAIFWLSIPILVFIVFIAAIYSNFWFSITTESLIADAADDFPIIKFIFENYVYLITVLVLIIAGVLYMKPSE